MNIIAIRRMHCAYGCGNWPAAGSDTYRRLTVMLKREDWNVNAKRIYRLYIEEGLIVRTHTRKQRAQRQRVALGQASGINQRWSMDFVAQRLADGRWIRVLTVVDQ
jgi:putative transposase